MLDMFFSIRTEITYGFTLPFAKNLGCSNTLIMTAWHVAGALVGPKSSTMNWYWPDGVLKAVCGLSVSCNAI